VPSRSVSLGEDAVPVGTFVRISRCAFPFRVPRGGCGAGWDFCGGKEIKSLIGRKDGAARCF
jgi:hypothetical protein